MSEPVTEDFRNLLEALAALKMADMALRDGLDRPDLLVETRREVRRVIALVDGYGERVKRRNAECGRRKAEEAARGHEPLGGSDLGGNAIPPSEMKEEL